MIKNAARKHPGGPLRKQDSFKLQNLRPAGKLGMTLTYWCKKKKTPDKHKKKKKMHTQNNQYDRRTYKHKKERRRWDCVHLSSLCICMQDGEVSLAYNYTLVGVKLITEA